MSTTGGSSSTTNTSTTTTAIDRNAVITWMNALPVDQKLLLSSCLQLHQADNFAVICDRFAQTVFGNVNQATQRNVLVPTPSMKVPVYDRKRMTADYFFVQVKKYFEFQGHEVARHVYLLGTVLEGNYKRWYENNVKPNTTWDACLLSFKTEFDTRYDKSERVKLLATRVQGDNETVSTYVYEMLFLASQVYPQEADREKLRRAYEGLHMDIYQTIKWNPDMPNTSAGSLIAAAEDALRILHRRQQSLSGGSNKLPPMQEGNSVATKSASGNDHDDKQACPSNPSDDARNVIDCNDTQHKEEIQCYHCNGFGHVQVKCPSKMEGVVLAFQNREVTCWCCGGEGHTQRYCTSYMDEEEYDDDFVDDDVVDDEVVDEDECDDEYYPEDE